MPGLHMLFPAILIVPLLVLLRSLQSCSFCSGVPMLAQLAPGEA